MKRRSLFGLHFDAGTQTQNKQGEEKGNNIENGHPDQEEMEITEHEIACESQSIFPT